MIFLAVAGVCLRNVSPGGVLERVLVVEGDEEAQNSQEHDSVSDDDQNRGAPVDLKKGIC